MASNSAIVRVTVPSGRSGASESKDTDARLSCPVYRHNPHSCEKSIACSGPGFPTIARLHEHLKRCHSEKAKLRAKSTVPILSVDQFEKVSKVIQAHPRNHPFEKWKEIYEALFPQDVCPAPTRPSLEAYVAETLQPSTAFKSRTIEMMNASNLIPGGLDPELLFDLCCQLTPLYAAAFGETAGRWGPQETLEVRPPGTYVGNDVHSSESIFQQGEMMEINDDDFVDMNTYDDETDALYRS